MTITDTKLPILYAVYHQSGLSYSVYRGGLIIVRNTWFDQEQARYKHPSARAACKWLESEIISTKIRSSCTRYK